MVGHMISIYSPKQKKYLRMNNKGDIDVSPTRKYGSIPDRWEGARFLVVNAGNDQVALHSPRFNRFIRMRNNKDMDASSSRAALALPLGWSWERFTAVRAGDGEVAFHNKVHKRFLRMTSAKCDASDTKDEDDLPDSWDSER